MKKLAITALIIGLAICATLCSGNKRGERMQEGTEVPNYVPTEKTASQIAEIILVPIYGEESIKKQMPFKVTLVKDSVWVVEGVQRKIELGGVAYIEIQKRDCKILKVTHGK